MFAGQPRVPWLQMLPHCLMPCTVSCNPLRDIQILSRFRPWEELSEDVGLRLVMGSSSELRTHIGEHHILLSLSLLILEFKFPVDSKQHWSLTVKGCLLGWRLRPWQVVERMFYSFFQLGPNIPAHTWLVFTLWAPFTPRNLMKQPLRIALKRAGTTGRLENKFLTVSIL